jgi:hypothetical protein
MLSAMAKIDRLPLLLALFHTAELYVTPGVFIELAHSFNLGRQYAIEVFALLTTGQLQVVYLTSEEVALAPADPSRSASGLASRGRRPPS